MSFLYKYNDGGVVGSKRSKQTRDCSVRAAAITFGIDYDVCYDVMARNGRKSSCGMSREYFNKALQELGTTYNKKIVYLSFPAEKGNPRMNTQKFLEKYKEGKFILNQAGHFSAAVDGVSEDSFTTWSRCVYSAWQVI
jgi:hypothetical protein